MIHKITYSLVFMLITSSSIAQYSIKDYLRAGDIAMDEANYNGALQHYGSALDLTDGSADIWYKYGTAAFKQNSYSIAEEAFGKYLNEYEGENQAKALYYLAQAQQLQGSYDKAIASYKLFTTEYPDFEDQDMVKGVELGLKSAEWAQDKDVSYTQYEFTQMGDDINTPFSEQGAYLLDDKLYFASLKYPSGEKREQTLISKILVNDEGESIVYGEDFMQLEDGFLASNPSFTQDGKIMAYTLCKYDENDRINCNINYATLDDNGNYINPQVLPTNINMTGFTTTQPNFRMEGDINILYFVSDRPGGEGGLDIWMSNFSEDMIFSTPVNAGLNTELDDITPFYHHLSRVLYFSSNGREGYGGFDVYKSIGSSISNVGTGVNTSYNDIYYYLKEDGASAYLSSNRLGSKYMDDSYQTCCYDIYEVNMDSDKIPLQILTFDANTKEELNNARIVIKDKETGEIIYDSNNPTSNIHNVRVDCERVYELVASKDGYEDYLADLGPYLDACDGGQAKEEIFLTPGSIDLTVNTYDKTTQELLNFAKVKLVCTATGQEATKSTGSTNQVRFGLDPYCTEYKLIGTKEGYANGEMTFSTIGQMGSMTRDLFLTKEKIATLEGLVPVRLYFDNDHPNPASESPKTNLWYSETYGKYYPKKSNFQEIFSRESGLIGRTEVSDFFDLELRKGKEDMDLLLSTLLEVLESGQVVHLYLRGYTSPLAQDAYNLALGLRRVETVKNSIKRWDGGLLMKYLNSEQLLITERSFGESTAPAEVSDSKRDKENSVYSPRASRERRVEIDEIKFNK